MLFRGLMFSQNGINDILRYKSGRCCCAGVFLLKEPTIRPPVYMKQEQLNGGRQDGKI